MESRITKETLLRQLLDAEKRVPDENSIYSYLLGYRLFQSPDQLLQEIQTRLCGKETPDVGRRFERRNQRMPSRSKGSACTKCQRKQENVKVISKSTNNMLEKDVAASTLYADMMRANVMVQATARPLPNNLSTSDSDSLSPALSVSKISHETLAKSSDFDSYCDIDTLDSAVFEDNRRNTAPPAALQALPSPQKLGQLVLKSKGHLVTDFTSKQGKTDFTSTASLGVLLEKLPETNIDDVQCADGVVADGEDTIKRRKKGRRRTTIIDNELTVAPTFEPLRDSNNSNLPDRASRDSGILSGLLDNELEMEFHNINNNNKKKLSETSENTSSAQASTRLHDDSGFMSQVSPNSMNETLDKLSEEIEVQICKHLSEETSDSKDACSKQLHLLHVLLVWVRDFPSDFRKTKTLGTLKGIISSLEKDSLDLKEHCAKVLETITKSVTEQTDYEKRLLQEDKDSTKRSHDFNESKEAMISMVTGMSDIGDTYKMAEQLCLIEMDLLSHLGAEEFLQMFNTSGKEDPKTNLGASVRWFNHLSHLVATSVCLCRKPKHRRQVISLFSKTASRCYQLSNFNSAIAILTGLSLGAVSRLKRTWSKINMEEVESLQTAFDPSNNFRRYRTIFNSRWAAMREHQETTDDIPSPSDVTHARVPENRYSSASQHSVTSRLSVASITSQHRDSGIECENDSSASSKSPQTSSSSSSPKRKFTFDDITSRTGIEDGVLVPFLTLMVKDVYFLNHSTSTIDHDGMINFEKLRHLGEILRPLETWKNTPCVYKKNEKIQDFLLHSPVLKDAELYSLSYKREPPKNKFEKTQLKTIRTELESSKRGNMVRRMIARRRTM